MPDELRKDQVGTSSGLLSRAGVGRFSGAVSSWFGSSTRLQTTGKFLRHQLWIWPVIAAVLIAAAYWWVTDAIESAMLRQRASDLNAMVDSSVTALRTWMGEQKVNVQLVADDEQLRPLVAELLALKGEGPALERQLLLAKPQDALRQHLNRRTELCGYLGYVVVSPSGFVLAADQDLPVGKKLTDYRKEVFDQANAGKTLVSKPFRSTLLLKDEHGDLRANLPSMYTAGPLRDESGKPIAALGLRIRPEDTFTKILQVAHFGRTGETFAFDRNGLLLSQSRFDDDLKQIGLLADQPDCQSILTVEVRDPQVNMAGGERPKIRRTEQPLTRLAAEAVQGNDGFDAAGYRDYRGVPSVGAWRWLADYDMAVATEIESAEAFQSVYVLRRAFWAMLAA